MDRDVRKMSEPEQDRLFAAFQAIAGDQLKRPEQIFDLETWWVKRFEGPGAAWMLLEVDPERMVPGSSAVRAHVFDSTWHRLAADHYPTGYREFLTEATIDRGNPLKEDLLKVTVTSAGPFIVEGDQKRPAFRSSTCLHQYYAFRSGRMSLVRIENDKGDVVTAHYMWAHPDMGPRPHWTTTESCVKSLRSGDEAEQLALLVWLSGRHLDSTKPRADNVSQEDVTESLLFESVRDNSEARAAITQLEGSSNTWVRDYARAFPAK